MKSFIKISLRIIGVLILFLTIVAFIVYFFFLQYPKLNSTPKIDKWYKVSSSKMMSSDGSNYGAYFKKGRENKVIIYFAGGGVSISAETAKEYDMYNTKVLPIDYLGNLVMNMSGIASPVDANPFKDWTVIAFPYATGDFHAGTGNLSYMDSNGNEKTLYHHGYTNFRAVMDIIENLEILNNTDSVLVTGYSAGAGGASLLANDVFKDYFPNVCSKTVLVDSMLLLNDNWSTIASDVWEAPTSISDRLATDNLVLDSLKALRNDFNDVNILFDCSTRDGDLAKVQYFFDTGNMEVDEKIADNFEQILAETIPLFREQVHATVFIWDGLKWYDDPRNLTMHTIIAGPYVFAPLNNSNVSIAEWVINAINGNSIDYGLNLLE